MKVTVQKGYLHATIRHAEGEVLCQKLTDRSSSDARLSSVLNLGRKVWFMLFSLDS